MMIEVPETPHPHCQRAPAGGWPAKPIMPGLGKVTDQCRRLLAEQEISHRGSGTILSDIQTMLDFIGIGGLATGSSKGNLPATVLPELNLRLSQPVEVGLTRALLRDYPNIAGLYVLLRVMDLVRADSKRISVDEEALARWSGLNLTEQYFALLEAWLIHADDAVLGKSSRRDFEQFQSNVSFLAEKLSNNWQIFEEYCHTYEHWGAVSTWNAQLQARFGLVELIPRPMEGRESNTRGWLMWKAKRTEWGQAAAWAIVHRPAKKGAKHLYFHHLPAGTDYGYFLPAFQPYFPEWQNLFGLAPTRARSGLYIFKANLDPRRYGGPIWRRLAVPDDTPLDQLAWAVLKAFGFYDFDHLYAFRFRDQFGKARVFHHPYTEEGPAAPKSMSEELICR
jgi:hypothetical protein